MATPDPEDIRLKSYEQLLAYSKQTFDFHLKRWDDNEAKVARFTTMLLALLGAGAFSVTRFARTLSAAPPGWLVYGWVGVYVLFALCALLSFGFYLWAFYYRTFRTPPSAAEVVLPFFENMRYVDVLVGLSKGYLEAAAEAERCAHTVQRAAHRGYLCFIAAVFFGLLSAGSYAIIGKEVQDAERFQQSHTSAAAGSAAAGSACSAAE